MRADLHIHTVASDGCWDPEQVVAQVRAAGIGLFAVADHETVANVGPTAEAARRAGLSFLTGAEISAQMNGTAVHILAYGIDPAHPGLNELLQANLERLNWVNEETLRRLADAGFPIDLQAYAAYPDDRSRGGWKGLNYLIDLGICRDVHDFLERLFVPPIRPPMPDFPQVGDVAEIVRAAGGWPVLAHPGMSLRHQGITEDTLRPFLEMGIAGLECFSSYHDEPTTRTCLDFCARHNLLVTGGSDCHGGFAGRRLGRPPVRLEELRLGPLEDRILR